MGDVADFSGRLPIWNEICLVVGKVPALVDEIPMKPLIFKFSGGLFLAAMVLYVILGHPAARYLNLSGLLLVVLGPLAAAVLAYSHREVVDLLRSLPDRLRAKPAIDTEEIGLFLRVAEWNRLGRIRNAEQMARHLREPILSQGADLVINRTPPAELGRLLQWKIGAQRELEQDQIRIVRLMAALAPAFGMLGTLFGLIDMMYALDGNQLGKIGAAMGFSLLTTVYGLVLANLILKPIAARLERGVRERLAWLHVQAEAVRLLQERSHPSVIQDYLCTYLERVEVAEALYSATLSPVKNIA